jgi:glycosyltransferase involved in cell wall biosynthesis
MTKATRIFFDARMYRMSGVGTYIQQLLPWLVKKKIPLSLFGNPSDLKPFDEPHVRIIKATSKIYTIAEQFEIWWHSRDCSILWTPHYNMCLLHRGKKITSIHDVIPLAVPQYIASRLAPLYARVVMNQLIRRSEVVMTISEFSKREIIRFFPYAAANTKICRFGFEPKAARAGAEEVVSGFGIRKPYLIYIGNLKPHKNVSRMIEAFLKVSEQDPSIQLVIVGQRDNFRSHLADLYKRFKNHPDIIFTGFVSAEHLQMLLQQSQALCFLSLYEGFGLPPMEAMAAGVPILVSDIPVIREVVGDAGRYVNPLDITDIASGMQQILSMTVADKQQFQRRAAERLKEFTVSEFYAVHEKALDAVLS